MRWFKRALVAAAIILAGLCALVVVSAAGPSEDVVCGSGHALNHIAQSIMQRLGAGHIDGPTANYCTVPATSTWIAATALFFVFVALAVIFTARRRPVLRDDSGIPGGPYDSPSWRRRLGGGLPR
jgi:hypothetical protein